jgi:hypothetical protein
MKARSGQASNSQFVGSGQLVGVFERSLQPSTALPQPPSNHNNAREQMDISKASQAELLNLLHCLTQRLEVAESHHELEGEVNRHIQALSESAKRVLKGGKDEVFAQYLLAKLQALAAVFVEAAGEGVLRVREHELNTAKLLLNAFGDSERVVRFTWKLAPPERLFEDIVWRKHFERSSAMANSGLIEIRTILIAAGQSQFQASNVRKLLEFYASQNGINAKIIETSVWDDCVVDHALPQDCIEFGIYGSNLLYEADTYTPVSGGKWSKDKIEIERFTHFFDNVWNSHAVVAQTAASPTQRVSLSQLMAVDSEHERRKNAVHESVARIEERIQSGVA